MRLTYHNHFCPCNDVVFSVMFGNSYLFCKLCSAVTGELVEIIGNPHSQATLNENDVMLNKIRFDSFAFAKSNKFYSVDIQRKYKKSRQERRTVYYGHLRKLLAAPARCRFVGAFAKKFEAILCVLTRIFLQNDQ